MRTWIHAGTLAFLFIGAYMGMSVFAQTTSCLRYTGNTALPSGYAASWDVFDSQRRLLVSSNCPTTGTALTVTIGRGDNSQLAWSTAYVWGGSAWAPYTLTGNQTNGWIPTAGSVNITTPFAVTAGNPLYFVGYVCTNRFGTWKCGCSNSACTTSTWQLQAYTGPLNQGGIETVATPTVTPPGGTFTTATQQVTMTTATADASIRYTDNGTSPTETSSLYTAPISIDATKTFKIKAFKVGMNPSAEISVTFTKGSTGGGGGGGGGGSQKKNILLIIADDLGLEASNLYPAANRRATTPAAVNVPNLKSLAGKGVLFTNAWALPSCTPTRSSIFTGRYAFRTGMGRPCSNEQSASIQRAIAASEFSLPEAFTAANAGYLLAHIGKWHLSWGINDPNTMGWPYFAGPDPRTLTAGLTNYMDWSKVTNGTASNSTTYNTTDLVNETIGRINAAKTQSKPYFIWLAFNAPHSPYHKPPNNLHSRDSISSCSNRRPCYEAMIEALDTEIGRLMAQVNLASTTVIFIGDNGTPNEVIASPYNANHAKLRIYEDGIRVPFLIAGAGVSAQGRIEAGLAQTVDLYPTILRLAGVDPGDVVPSGVTIDGVSLLPYLGGAGATGVRQYSYSEQFMNSTPTDTFERAIRNQRYKYIKRTAGHANGPAEEFFDLQVDPYETDNLLPVAGLSATETTNFNTLKERMNTLIGN